MDGGKKQKRKEFLTFLLSYNLFSRLVYSMPVMYLCGQLEIFHSQEYIVYAQQLSVWGLVFNDDIKSRRSVWNCVRMFDLSRAQM